MALTQSADEIIRMPITTAAREELDARIQDAMQVGDYSFSCSMPTEHKHMERASTGSQLTYHPAGPIRHRAETSQSMAVSAAHGGGRLSGLSRALDMSYEQTEGLSRPESRQIGKTTTTR